MPDLETEASITHEGQVYHHAPAGHRGKKALQVAGLLEQLMENPGVPLEFDAMCAAVDAKYPQDVQAAVFALEMTELVHLYYKGGNSKKAYYVWTDEPADVVDIEA